MGECIKTKNLLSMKFGLVKIKIKINVKTCIFNKNYEKSFLTKKLFFFVVGLVCGFVKVKKGTGNITKILPSGNTLGKNQAFSSVTFSKPQTICKIRDTIKSEYPENNGISKTINISENSEIKLNFIEGAYFDLAQITTLHKTVQKKLQCVPVGGTLILNEEILAALYLQGSVGKNVQNINIYISLLKKRLKLKNIKVEITQKHINFELSPSSIEYLKTLPQINFATAADEILIGDQVNLGIKPDAKLNWFPPTTTKETFASLVKNAPVSRVKGNVCFDFNLDMNGHKYPYDMKRYGEGTCNYFGDYRNRLRGFDNKESAAIWLINMHEKMIYKVTELLNKQNIGSGEKIILEHFQTLLFTNVTEFHQYKNHHLFIKQWNNMHYQFHDIYKKNDMGFNYVGFINPEEDLKFSSGFVAEYKETFQEIYKPENTAVSLIDRLLHTRLLSTYVNISSSKTFIIKSPADNIMKHCYYAEMFKDIL